VPVVEPSSMDANAGNAGNLIPRSKVFSDARRCNLDPSDDRFDRLRDVALLDDLGPVLNSKERGFTPTQAKRFIDLLTIGKELRSKRPRASELAFFLCWSGERDVPPELVCEQIERSVLAFLRWFGRECDRRRTPIDGNLRSEKRWERIGRSWARFVTKSMWRKYLDRPVIRDLIGATFAAVFRAIFSAASFESVAGKLRNIAFVVVGRDVPISDLKKVWEGTREVAELFSPDERTNKLLLAIREIRRTNPLGVIQLVHDTRNHLDALGEVFPAFAAALAKNEPSDHGWVPVVKALPAQLCAVLAVTAQFPRAIEIRKQLREGNRQQALAEFYNIKIVRDDIMNRLHIGGQEHGE
jgi:hypothetical protein